MVGMAPSPPRASWALPVLLPATGSGKSELRLALKLTGVLRASMRKLKLSAMDAPLASSPSWQVRIAPALLQPAGRATVLMPGARRAALRAARR